MKLVTLSIQKLEIPFNISFSHASATRRVTDSVIVRACGEHQTGYGESCPRVYVTNEAWKSVLDFFTRHQPSIIDGIYDIASLKQWAAAHAEAIDLNPAAWCAIELALLDLISREDNCSVEALLGLPWPDADFQYSAVLGDSDIEAFTGLLERYKAIGFTDYKLKLSGQLAHDKEKCDLIVRHVKHARLRLDANNLWSNPDEVIAYIKNLGHPFFALEEPVTANDYEGLLSVAQSLGISIVLDESFIRLKQFETLQGQPGRWIINIRVSKMGGLLRSLAIAERAREVGIHCIVGAQVGETSMLTRASMVLVNAYRDIVLAQEGAFGTHLLEHDIFQPMLMFGKSGRITQAQLSGLRMCGFGLDLDSVNEGWLPG